MQYVLKIIDINCCGSPFNLHCTVDQDLLLIIRILHCFQLRNKHRVIIKEEGTVLVKLAGWRPRRGMPSGERRAKSMLGLQRPAKSLLLVAAKSVNGTYRCSTRDAGLFSVHILIMLKSNAVPGTMQCFLARWGGSVNDCPITLLR